MGLFTKFFTRTKMPTTKQDAIAYSSGGNKTFSEDYNTYLSSVETLDKAIRIFANVASMATMNVSKVTPKGELKPLKVSNVDVTFYINENDGPADFLRKVFASILTQGAAVIIAEKSKETSFIGFYPYNPAKFSIDATEKSLITTFTYTSEGGSEIDFKPQDIIYINNSIDATNLVYPISRLKPLNDIMVLQANIMKQTSDYFAAGAKDSVIISPKEPISAESARLLKATFDEFIQSRQTKTLFLNTDIDVKSVSNAQTPVEIMNSLTAINKMIVEAYGIPEYLYGSYDGYVNDAAVKTACRLFFEVHVKPLFKTFDHQMTKYFRNTLKLKDAVVHSTFENVEILHDSLETKVDLSGKLLKLGIISLNEAREMVELEPLAIEDADKHWLPSYLVSSRPVSVEDYSQLLAEGFFDNGMTSNDSPDTGTGASGGADNETQLTSSDSNTEPAK